MKSIKTKLAIVVILIFMILSACSTPARKEIGNIEEGDYITFGKYEQDNDTSNGKEDIEWLVLDVRNDRALVISKYALDAKQYNTNDADVTWGTSTIREWLNNYFYNNAFAADEKVIIPTISEPTDENSDYETSTGNETLDRVFLLSINEAENYFSSDAERQCKATNYAFENGVNIYDEQSNLVIDTSVGNCIWALRSPGGAQDFIAGISYDGSIDVYGGYIGFSFGDPFPIAVRPALWINMNP